MTSSTIRGACVAAVLSRSSSPVGRRIVSRPPASKDPRVGLKPGLRNAGEAISNLELMATLPKPAGFFNPKAPNGTPTGPKGHRTRRTPAPAGRRRAGAPTAAAGTNGGGTRRRPRRSIRRPPTNRAISTRTRVRRPSHVRRQLPRLQHL